MSTCSGIKRWVYAGVQNQRLIFDVLVSCDSSFHTCWKSMLWCSGVLRIVHSWWVSVFLVRWCNQLAGVVLSDAARRGFTVARTFATSNFRCLSFRLCLIVGSGMQRKSIFWWISSSMRESYQNIDVCVLCRCTTGTGNILVTGRVHCRRHLRRASPVTHREVTMNTMVQCDYSNHLARS